MNTQSMVGNLPIELQDHIYDYFVETSPDSTVDNTLTPLVVNPQSKNIDFLNLPTEIRHLIYRNVFHEKYVLPSHRELTFPSSQIVTSQAPLYAGNYAHKIGLLETSKEVRRDAVDFLYAKVTFSFQFPYGTKETLVGPCQTIIDRMNNIEIDIDMAPYLSLDSPQRGQQQSNSRSKEMDIFYTTILRKLGARADTGNMCCVVFWNCNLEQASWHELPFFEALSGAATFRRVVVELRCWPAYVSPLFSFLSVSEINCLYENLRGDLKKGLERTLGKGRGQDRDGVRRLEFRPQKSSVKKSEAKVLLVSKESNEGEGGEDGCVREDSDEESLDEDYDEEGYGEEQ